MSKPTIVVVPGAWHSPAVFDLVAKRLEAAGYEVHGVTLATVGAPEPCKDFSPDVEAIRAVIKPLVEQEKDVLMVVHSYGGVVGSEAVRGFNKVDREKEGKKGGVSHMFYCCAFVLPEGVSLMDGLQGTPPPWFQISEDETIINPATPIETFYNDVENPQQYVDMLKPQSYGPIFTKATYAAWKTVPCTYLLCEKDMAISIDHQKAMVGFPGANFKTETVDAGHSPFLSVPDEVANAIRRAAGEAI